MLVSRGYYRLEPSTYRAICIWIYAEGRIRLTDTISDANLVISNARYFFNCVGTDGLRPLQETGVVNLTDTSSTVSTVFCSDLTTCLIFTSD